MFESIKRKFLCGDDEDKNKIYLVAWDVVIKSKENRGLGVGCLNSTNLALFTK